MANDDDRPVHDLLQKGRHIGDVILQAIGSRNAPGETMSSQIQTIHLKGGGQRLKQRPPLLPSAVPSMQIQKRLARGRPLRVIEFDRAV